MPIGWVKVYLKKQCINECKIEINIMQATKCGQKNKYIAYWKINFTKIQLLYF